MAKPYQRIPTGDASADKVQEESARRQKDVTSVPLLSGLHTTAVLPAGVDTAIPHKLGRQIRGWIFHDIQGGPPSVWRIATGNETKTLTLHNGHTGTLTVALWVW